MRRIPCPPGDMFQTSTNILAVLKLINFILIGKDKLPPPLISILDSEIKDGGAVLSDVCTQSIPICVGLVDSELENSGVGKELPALLAQDINCLVSHCGDVRNCAGHPDHVVLSDSAALALFRATLSYDGPLPEPIVNFDDDALISSLIHENSSASVGRKQATIRKKTCKKTTKALRSAPRAEEVVIEHSVPSTESVARCLSCGIDDCNVGFVQCDNIIPP